MKKSRFTDDQNLIIFMYEEINISKSKLYLKHSITLHFIGDEQNVGI